MKSLISNYLFTILTFISILINSINSQFIKSNDIKSCSNSNFNSNSLTSTESLINFVTVYAQFDTTKSGQLDSTGTTIISNSSTGNILRVVLIGSTALSNPGYSNSTNFLTTLVVNTDVLTFTIGANQSSFCSAVRTLGTSGQTSNSSLSTTSSFSGCPYGPGIIAVGFSIPLANNYPLTTITSQVTILSPDLVANHLACVNLSFTPYYPNYFAYSLIHYFPIGLLALYFLLYLISRIYASHTDFVHEQESKIAASLTLALSTSNLTISKRGEWFGAWAGRQVVGSGSLRRFVTAELRELWQIIAWFSLVGTAAVNWPDFAYPVFAETAWSALIYNATLPFTSPASPLLPLNSTGPINFASQISNRTSPLFLDSTVPPVLLDLTSSENGIEKWSQTIGVRNQDLWSICTFTFLVICGIVILIHLIAAWIDYLVDIAWPSKISKGRSKALQNDLEVDQKDKSELASTTEFDNRKEIHSTPPPSRNGDFSRMSAHDGWGENEEEEIEMDDEPRPEDNFPSWQLHLASLQGNLTRVLLLFHLPLSLFSIYQISLHATSPLSSIVLASFTLAIICVATPAFLLYRIHITPVDTLFTSLPTLLSIGPLYNTYSDECTMFSTIRFLGNLLIAIVIGGLQSYGTAQSAVILFVEVTDTLVTSLWLPWGDNTAMGPLAFILSISRIIIAVLLVVLSPAVGVSDSASGWLAYIVFLMQGLVAILLLIVVIFKAIELVVRFLGPVPFDESPSGRAGGLSGALRKWDRTGKGGNRSNSNSNSSGGKSKKQLAAKTKRLQLSSGGERRFSASETSTLGRGGGRSPRNLHSPQPLLQTSGGVSRSSSYVDRQYSSSDNNNHRHPQYSTTYPQALDLGNDDAIMSAMTIGPWVGGGTTGYVPPGAYNSSIHTTSPPATQSSSTGFTRVGGGKSSSSNPYQLANIVSPPPPATTSSPSTSPRGYPPYPISSADHYSLPPSPNSNSSNLSHFQSQLSSSSSQQNPNPRRLSQSAVIEMASSNHFDSSSPLPPSSSSTNTNTNNNSPSFLPPTALTSRIIPPTEPSRHQTRTSISLPPPSSSVLLSNSVPPSRYSIDSPSKLIASASGDKSKSKRGGRGDGGGKFLDRFRRNQSPSRGEDFSTDEDEDDSDDEDSDVVPARIGGVGSGGVRGKLKNILGGAGGGGRKKVKGKGKGKERTNDDGIEMENSEEMEELASPIVGDAEGAPAKTFVVTRKPRPSVG